MIEYPNDPVVILCGASGAGEIPPEGLILPTGQKAGRFAGGSYTSGGEALTRLDVQVANEAQAGAYSFDIPEIQSYGYRTQLERGLSSTLWIDGDHSTAVVFDQMNDCMHSAPFTEEQADFYIANLQEAVHIALQAGKQVIVNQLMDFEDLDLKRALAPFGITETISEIDYAILDSKHRDAFGSRTDITYLDTYKNMTTIDGLHHDFKTAMEWARKIKKALK